MFEFDKKENIIKDFEEFKKQQLETDLQKLIDLYIMSMYYDIMDYLQEEPDDNAENVIEYIENTIKEYYK